ncbi:hypothetical protein ACSYDW_05430 [Paeniglutamicibacter sp. R2-26]|uniref:hypothetical protein n=1 Tax=Paeniglutamicibacter sp. R2-26 TaxID=3144417 RepID=UPI003EE51E00
MNTSWLVRAAAIGIAGMLVAGVAVTGATAETEASWMHPQAAQATVAAAVAPAPVGVNCTSSDSALGGPVATIRWSAPASVNGATITYVVAGKRNAGDAAWTKIADASGNSYAFGNGLLGGLVGGILNLLFGGGSEITVGVIALHTFSGGAVWESVPGQTVKVSKAQGGALGLLDGFKCG